MKALTAGIATLVGMFALTSLAQACTYCYACSPVMHVPLPQAPSPCNIPGYYIACPDGTALGPNYWLRPPGLPFNGSLPGPMGQTIEASRPMPMRGPMPMGGPGMLPMPNMALPQYGMQPTASGQRPTAFPTHPYVRGPRDFFMWRESMEEMNVRPRLVP